MRTAVDAEPLIQELEVTDREIVVRLCDGRVISVPIKWSWRLAEATPAERANFYLSGDGAYAHWPDIDEDLSAQGMLTGTPAPRPGSSSEPSDQEEPRKRVPVARKSPSANRRRSADG